MESLKIDELLVMYDSVLFDEETITNFCNKNYCLLLFLLLEKEKKYYFFGNEQDKDALTYSLLNDVLIDAGISYYKEDINDEVVYSLFKNYELLSESDKGLFYAIIGQKYYSLNNDEEGYINYLQTHENYDEVLEWFKESYSIEIYNYLINGCIKSLIASDKDIIKYIDSFTKLTLSSTNDKTNNVSNINIKASEEEIKELGIEFLDAINAPDDWKNLYKELFDNNRIIMTEEPEESHYDRENGSLYVIYDGKIDTFCVLIHEFIHYVVDVNNEQIDFSLIEFPSIYFEYLSALFLEYKGYSNIILDNQNSRKENNKCMIDSIGELLNDINYVVNNGTITKEYKKKSYKKYIDEKINGCILVSKYSKDLKDFEEELIREYNNINYEEKITDNICISNNDLIYNKENILYSYSYLIGTYISDYLFNMTLKDKMTIEKMKVITTNLSNYSLGDIINVFGLNEIVNNKQDYSRERKTKK